MPADRDPPYPPEWLKSAREFAAWCEANRDQLERAQGLADEWARSRRQHGAALAQVNRRHLETGAAVVAEQSLSIARGAQRALGDAVEAAAPLISAVQRAAEVIAKNAGPVLEFVVTALARLHVWIEQEFPPNWNRHRIDRIFDYSELAMDGIPVTWVPRASILDALADCPDHAARLTTLLTHREEIVADCRSALAGCAPSPDPNIALYARILGQSCDALARGEPETAQINATVVADTIMSAELGLDARRAKRELAVQESPEYLLSEFRKAITFVALLPAIKGHVGRDASPRRFNRHGSIHRASPQTLRPAFALVALMLATSMLCEISRSEAPAQQIA